MRSADSSVVKAKGREEPIFLAACRGRPVPRTPVWLMRQAGRYLPEYRRVRSRHGFLEMCRSPGLAARVTVEAAERLGVDAAILFSDLLIVLSPLGFRLSYPAHGGPRIANPVRTPRDVARLREHGVAGALGFVYEAAERSRGRLDRGVPLIGFTGAPFTLASYLIEGGGSRDWAATRTFMRTHTEAWDRLLGILARAAGEHLAGQIRAGAQAVQLFDSWVGCLSPADYRRYVLPRTREVFRALPRGVPTIHFGTGTAGLLEAMKEAGGTVMGLDHRVSLSAARARLGGMPVMGNLDPTVLLAPRRVVLAEARRILAEAGGRPGHVFNLGHGILPQTPVENVLALVDLIRRS